MPPQPHRSVLRRAALAPFRLADKAFNLAFDLWIAHLVILFGLSALAWLISLV